ncbi:MAG: hypothetical protein ACLQED_05190 [Desulfobaccales bacterium]
MPHKQLTLFDTFFWISLVLVVCVLACSFLIDVPPISKTDSSKSELELLAVILGILAAGCTSAFFSFSYKDAGQKEHGSVRIIAWSLIIAFALLVFLCMYCLQKVGAFGHTWERYIVFLATFFMLCGPVLIEQWDATLLTRKKSNNFKDKNCPFCKCLIPRKATRCPKWTSDLSQNIN